MEKRGRTGTVFDVFSLQIWFTDIEKSLRSDLLNCKRVAAIRNDWPEVPKSTQQTVNLQRKTTDIIKYALYEQRRQSAQQNHGHEYHSRNISWPAIGDHAVPEQELVGLRKVPKGFSSPHRTRRRLVRLTPD